MRQLLAAGFITFAAVNAAASDRTRPDVPLAIDARGGIRVAVHVNGAGPFTFILDTGSSRSAVSEDLARELAAPVVAKSEVLTMEGSAMRLVVRLSPVVVAPARVEALLAPILPARQLAPLGPGIRGLLGQDFLSGFNYTLDYRRSRLTWDEPLTCEAPNAVRMSPVEGRFVLMADSDGGSPLRLVPDSGAEVAVLFRGRRAGISAFRVGRVTVRDVPVAVVERDDPNADGLLPLHRFGAVSFAAGGACLVVR